MILMNTVISQMQLQKRNNRLFTLCPILPPSFQTTILAVNSPARIRESACPSPTEVTPATAPTRGTTDLTAPLVSPFMLLIFQFKCRQILESMKTRLEEFSDTILFVTIHSNGDDCHCERSEA